MSMGRKAGEWKRWAVRGRNRDGVWLERGVCTQSYDVGQAGVVRKLSGGVSCKRLGSGKGGRKGTKTVTECGC